ncbi:hypothetical protein ABH15_10830 [Methanoculleus taiwanensis]|uniref:Prenyltransferase n=1 Tax=Methanoculleus taiwanensis TaxID=1550565 RepID=A0A498GZK7_9EURY|nr:UbiA family prenyltransferase [Methanoculleus taiwanensis]RXE55270.1 hypothetical protein ABH15_10830 [Methanoculleus taiwanensis]
MQGLNLLYSILIVSLSGGLKVQFAYELLGYAVPLNQVAAAFLVTYAAYAFDRGVDNKEDEERGKLFKKVLLWSAILCTIASLILFPNPALLIPFLIAYLYAKGIRGFRLKGGAGVKNAVVAFTWSLLMVILLGIFSIPAMLLYMFFFSKSFVNTVIYDVRDIENDARAGIQTIPTRLKKPQLITLLVTVTVMAHGAVLYAYSCGLLANVDVILISSLHSIFYILRYCNDCEMLRNTLVDGEWILYQGIQIFRDCFM